MSALRHSFATSPYYSPPVQNYVHDFASLYLFAASSYPLFAASCFRDSDPKRDPKKLVAFRASDVCAGRITNCVNSSVASKKRNNLFLLCACTLAFPCLDSLSSPRTTRTCFIIRSPSVSHFFALIFFSISTWFFSLLPLAAPIEDLGTRCWLRLC